MNDKWLRLAEFLVTYSTRIQPGEISLIHCVGDVRKEFVSYLIEEILKAGGQPLIWQDNPAWLRQLINTDNHRGLNLQMNNRLREIKKVQAVFHLFSEGNVYELFGLPVKRLDYYLKLARPIVEWRCNKTKRILTSLPSEASAQLAGMSTAQFDKFYFDVCLGVDYLQMDKAMDLLVKKMQATDKVTIVGPGTDISFSIKGIPAIKCAGRENLPDGEVFTAPVKESINGCISFNTPTNYNGQRFDPLSLSYQSGRLVGITASNQQQQKAAEEILHTDNGAQYVGEFAFGLNPQIVRPVGEILFDEKIAGSIHFTPGSCYAEASNGNDNSAIHWDMILRQTADCGGGEVYFDGELIRKDGLFLGELAALNPENLKV